MTTLEIVTRHMPSRMHLLARNKARLTEQTCGDWVQTVITDTRGVGIANAGRLLANHEPQADYVWVLDDDDYVAHRDTVRLLVERLKRCKPDAMFVRFNHGYAILPTRMAWHKRPEMNGIGGSSIITSAAVWRQCRHHWDSGRYQSDYDFVIAAYDHSYDLEWYDIIAACMDKQRQGAAV